MKGLTAALLLLSAMEVFATENIVWQGTKKFMGWSDVLNIEGNRLSKAEADDVLRLSITVSSGAQLQISWGNGYTCFDGLDCKDINGDFDMVLSAQDAARLRQGIHIKGINYTLTAVTLVSNDGEYETESIDLFPWTDMLLSGATQGQKCTVGLKPYGGAGWFWPEPIDLSGYGSIVVKLLQPTAAPLTVQLFFGEKSVKRQTIEKGATQCKITLSTAHKKAYSLNFISEKAQTVVIGSVNLTDKQGNVIGTGIESVSASSQRVFSVEYYDTSGIRHTHPTTGINIVKLNIEGGRTIIRKELK